MKKILGLVAGACAGLVIGAFVSQAIAARNGSGTMSLYSPGNPVVTGTTITSTWANTTASDIATELTDSLSRSGKGGMLAPLKLTNGTVGAPALSFTSDSDSGLYRNAASDLRMSIDGVDRQAWNTSGSDVTGRLTVDTAGANAGTLSTSSSLLFGSTSSGVGISSCRTGGCASVTGTNGLDFYTGSTWRGGIGPTGDFSIASQNLYIGGAGDGLIGARNTDSKLYVLGNKAAGSAGTDVTVGANLLRTNGDLWEVVNNAATRKASIDFAGNLTLVGSTITLGSTTFASLGTPSDGVFKYCSDCTIASPCAGAGTGALAKRLNGAWVCN